MAAEDFIITRKRKKYRFACFAELDNCYETHEFTATVRDNFVNNAPLTLELGAGTGLFSVELARRYPHQRYIAVDVKADRLQKGASVASEQKLENICFLRAHAGQLPELFLEKSLTQLWLTFPDPYPKKRQAKHRMTHPHFLDIYRTLLAKRGIFHFKTDNASLFEWSLEQLAYQKALLEFIRFDLHGSVAPKDYDILTTYEQRYLAERKLIRGASARF